jgi:hypothetical protein
VNLHSYFKRSDLLAAYKGYLTCVRELFHIRHTIDQCTRCAFNIKSCFIGHEGLFVYRWLRYFPAFNIENDIFCDNAIFSGNFFSPIHPRAFQFDDASSIKLYVEFLSTDNIKIT